jgi:hypothetical protein
MPRHLLAVLLAFAACAPASAAPPKSWPPATGPGALYAHYGEEHITDVDGAVVLPRVVEEVIRFRPDLVTMSGDKTDDGTEEKLAPWRDLMTAYDRAGIPYMAGVGNHDGKQATPEAVTDAAAGSTPLRDVTFYKQVFASRPYPMGDAAPYPGLQPSQRPAGDPAGAATHFFVDHGNVRWVFLDNSCYGITNCDPLQNPPDDSGRDQYTFLRDAASEANAAGKLVFVVMHMPTRDPRDQQNAYYTSVSHTMGKGGSPDNQRFEQEAAQLGVDAVFVGHIKGQFLYTGDGKVPYFIDGGAGGELYSSGPLGVDHGYWYGFRLIRVDGTRIQTDVVPVIVPGGISVDGPRSLQPGEEPVTFRAFARQPAAKSKRAVVTGLELRDPDPVPRSSDGGATIPWTTLAWLLPLLLFGALALRSLPRPLLAPALLGVALFGLGGLALAQRSEPDDTPPASLPNPARIFTSGDPLVLAPVASQTDDPRRDAARQTADGRFAPRCPGRTKLSVTSGFETRGVDVVVRSNPARRIVRSVRRSGRRRAVVRLRQPAVVRVSRGGRRLSATCLPAGRHVVSLGRRRGTVTVRVTSDRRAVARRFRVR